MKVKNVQIKLEMFGKPVIWFEAIPENDLEQDALRTMSELWHKASFDKAIESLHVQPHIANGKYMFYTGWQTAHPK